MPGATGVTLIGDAAVRRPYGAAAGPQRRRASRDAQRAAALQPRRSASQRTGRNQGRRSSRSRPIAVSFSCRSGVSTTISTVRLSSPPTP